MTNLALRLGMVACTLLAVPFAIIGHDRAVDALYKTAWSLDQRQRPRRKAAEQKQ